MKLMLHSPKLSRNTTVTAVLGPTNTGKTHLAVERMLAMGGGMIGLPLRLLAREIFERIKKHVDPNAVALVTGEEKIIPPNPRYWVATVEAMPASVDVPFVAIDEVQLANDLERGHIFTDRILHCRGREETMLLGSATMRASIERLLPGTAFISRPRLSKLTYAGQRKLTRLPRRTAIVAFTAEMVYTVAELIRRQQGGAAVVMGALSPRTRNAQVALYQSGEVDYLVATDAIGMGLNMDVDHVAFAATRKFDGFQFRNLTPAEMGQIAGRAGRYMNDGTFGITGDADAPDSEVIERLENHVFETVRTLQWRNRDLNFRSLDTLRKSLGNLPRLEGLTRAQSGADIQALEAISRDPAIYDRIKTPKEVALAWEVCQIPDYRNISPAEHAHLISRVLTFLKSGNGFISEDWFASQIAHSDNTTGDIDTLSTRISHIRTWTFIANRQDWLEAPLFWQSRTREIEDRLSDALHERLTQRFINPKTSVMMRRLARKEGLMTSVEEDGAIRVEGELIGHIRGLCFVPDAGLASDDTKVMRAAALQSLSLELSARAKSLSMTADPELKLTRDGRIIWLGNAVGHVSKGDHRFKPRVEIDADEGVPSIDRTAALERLEKFVSRNISNLIDPLLKLQDPDSLQGTSRGLAFRLAENYGVLPRESVSTEVKSLTQEERAALRAHGVRFGAHTIFLPALLKPAATDIRLLLWWLEHHAPSAIGTLPASPVNGLTSTPANFDLPHGFYLICGYRLCGTRAVRVDMVERLVDMIRDRVFWKPRIPEEQRPSGSVEGGGFTIIPDLMSLVGCSGEEFENLLQNLDYRPQKRNLPRPPSKPTVTAQVEVTSEPVAQAEVTAEPTVDIASAPDANVANATEAIHETNIIAEIPQTIEAPETIEATPETTNIPETIEVNVWWPKDTGPFRPVVNKPKPPARLKRSDVKPERHPKHARQAKPEHKPKSPPPSRERPADPNSPFAVLSALKSRMTDRTS